MQLFSFLESTEQSAESWSVFEPVLIVLVVYSPFNQVRFSRPESEQARQRRIQSYEFLQKKQAEEPWVHLHYHGVKVCVIMWPTTAHLTDASKHNVNHIKQKHYICIVFLLRNHFDFDFAPEIIVNFVLVFESEELQTYTF